MLPEKATRQHAAAFSTLLSLLLLLPPLLLHVGT
jgi:hypothetical protein